MKFSLMSFLVKEHEKYFSKLNVLSLLGQGSYGTVYEVHDETTNESFALKEIPFNFKHVDRVTNEILPPGTNHENILNYSALFISKRPFKFGDVKYGKKKQKLKNTENFLDQLDSNLFNNISNENVQYEDFSSPFMDSGELIKKIDDFDYKYKRRSKSLVLDMNDGKHFNGNNFNLVNNWRFRSIISKKNSFKEDYYLYLKTKVCDFSLRDFIDARNERMFSEKKSKSTHLIYNSELKTSGKIPIELYNKSVNDDNSANRIFSLKLIRYILLGLIYLHSLGISHNDLKASNIFMDSCDSFIPRIGDFGCKTFCCKHDVSFGRFYNNEYPQVDSVMCVHQNSDKIGDCKSIGIILFELLYPTRTKCEIKDLITNLQIYKTVPECFKKKFKEESDIIEIITRKNNIRASDILILVENILRKII